MQKRIDQISDFEALSRALDASRRQLEAATRQNDKLLRQGAALTERVSSLELELASAREHALYDELTGLPNRRLLHDRFNQASAIAARHRKQPVLPDQQRAQLALLFFDLNNFKAVNDTFGHAAGDELLRQVAARLSTSIRQSDTACRYGGDEFVILLADIDSRAHAAAMLQRVHRSLAPAYRIESHSIRQTLSNGMAIYPADAQSLAGLLRLSDRRMFGKKSASRGPAG